MRRILKLFTDCNYKYYNIVFILLLVSSLLFIQTNFYMDLSITSKDSMSLLDAIFGKGIWRFYQDYSTGDLSCGYPLTVYLVFAIWNLPFYLIRVLFGVNLTETVYFLLWDKIMLIIFVWMSAIIVDRIAIKLGFSDHKRVITLLCFLSQNYILYAAMLVGQYDIIGIFFMLLGLLGLMESNKRKYLFWFGLAITCKLLPIVFLIPLIIYSNDKIKNMIKDFAISLIPLLLLHENGLIFGFFKNAAQPISNESTFTTQLLGLKQTIMVGNYYISLMAVAYILLCLWCYKHRGKQQIIDYVTILAVSTGILVILGNINAYWCIFMAPFIILMIMARCNNIEFSLLIETIVSTAMCLLYIIVDYPWCTTSIPYDHTIAKAIFGADNLWHLISTYSRPLDAISSKAYLLKVALGSLIFTLYGYLYYQVLSNKPTKQAVCSDNEMIVSKQLINFRLTCYCGLVIAPYVVTYILIH